MINTVLRKHRTTIFVSVLMAMVIFVKRRFIISTIALFGILLVATLGIAHISAQTPVTCQHEGSGILRRVSGSCPERWKPVPSAESETPWGLKGSDVYYEEGGVGIGTDNLFGDFHIKSDRDENLVIRSSDGLLMEVVDDGRDVNVPFEIRANELAFNTGSADGLSIANNGNVGVGTTSPSEKLHVAGNIQFGSAPYIRSADGGYRFESSADNSRPYISVLPTGDENDSALWLYGQADGENGTRLDLIQNANESIFRNQSIGGGGSNGSILFQHNGITNMAITSAGNVGIGTTTPRLYLDVKGTAVFGGTESDIFVGEDGNNKMGIFGATGEVPGSGSKSLWLSASNANETNSGFIGLYSSSPSNSESVRGDVWIRAGHWASNDMYGEIRLQTNEGQVVIANNGNVGIGTTTPETKLHVQGGDIRVGNQNLVVPDYVFENEYQMPTLDQLRQYVAREKHLPNIPSAAEIKANGLNLGEFQMKLLEKSEELVLYTLQQEDKIIEQQERISELESLIESMEQRLSALEGR